MPVLTLQVEDLVVDRGERRVLDGVSFALPAGHALVVTGPNGAGKSTLLRAIAGLVAVAGGVIRLATWEDRRASAIHLVGHLNAIKPQLTVEENCAFWCRWLSPDDPGEALETRVEDALEAVGLLGLAESPTQFLSQGQRRRLALARLVAAPRPVWLLDEPVAGLDAASRATFAATMARHVEGGGLILAATHEPLGLEEAGELRLDPA
jgi:heme exporter protein A